MHDYPWSTEPRLAVCRGGLLRSHPREVGRLSTQGCAPRSPHDRGAFASSRALPYPGVPPLAPANRPCGFPAYGFPTTCLRRHARAPAASPGPRAGLEATRSKPGAGLTDDGPRPACQPPVPQAKPHLSIQGLPRPGGVAHLPHGAPRGISTPRGGLTPGFPT